MSISSFNFFAKLLKKTAQILRQKKLIHSTHFLTCPKNLTKNGCLLSMGMSYTTGKRIERRFQKDKKSNLPQPLHAPPKNCLWALNIPKWAFIKYSGILYLWKSHKGKISRSLKFTPPTSYPTQKLVSGPIKNFYWSECLVASCASNTEYWH